MPQRALQKTVYLAETIHKRSREAAISLAAEVAFAACAQLVNVPGKAVREAGIGMFAVKRHMKVLDLDNSVRKLMQKGRVANALQAADSLREAGFRAKLWAKDGADDILWKRRSDSFSNLRAGAHVPSRIVNGRRPRRAHGVERRAGVRFYEVKSRRPKGPRLLHTRRTIASSSSILP